MFADSLVKPGADLAQCPSLSLFKIKIIHHEGHEAHEGKRIVIFSVAASICAATDTIVCASRLYLFFMLFMVNLLHHMELSPVIPFN